ncbi:MAG: DUF5018 domain-containing protein [Bacteroidales bacterium]|nr:DUF5018 domain-containing protein [Bacteroidales bacterium]
MKKIALLFASALVIGAVACNKNPEPTPSPSNDPSKDAPSSEDPVEKSKACKIVSLSVAAGDVTINGEIFEEEKFVELTYEPEQAFALSNAVATVEISEKATIAPDPATITDWTKEVKLTVTAEDGTTKAEYSVKPAPRQYTVAIARTKEELAVNMGAATHAKFGGNLHAFCAVDKWADAEGNVFDLNLAKVGTLDMTGLDGGVIVSMDNDEKGVLVATVGYATAEYTGTPTSSAELVSTRIFAWKDGWDKAPVMLYDNPGNVAQYLNISGNLAGDMYAFAYTDGRNGQHHVWTFHEGSRPSGDEWRFFDTRMLDNRMGDSCDGDQSKEYFYASGLNNGLSSGQNVSALEITPGEDGKPSGGIYVSLSASPEWDGTLDSSSKEWWRLGGDMVFVREGIDGKDIAMPAALFTNGLITNELKHGGPHQYGNTDFAGGLKAFNYSGNHYAAIAHVGVQNAYLTIQNIDYYLTGEGSQYLLSSVQAVTDAPTNNKPSVSFVFDPATGNGYVLAGYIAGNNEATPAGYVLYTLTREAIQ